MITDIHRNLLLFFDSLFQSLLFQRFGFRQILLQQGKQYGIKHNRQNSACQHQVLSRLRQQIERHAESGENKGELADLRQAGGNGQRGSRRVAEHTHQEKRSDRFAKDDNGKRRQHRQRLLDQD